MYTPYDIKIEGLNLNARTYNAMKASGHDTVNDIIKMTMVDLRHIRGLGDKGTKELLEKVHEYYPGWLNGREH